MKPMRENGLEEIQRVKRRAQRLMAMRRVTPDDASYIITRCNEIEARIVVMHEQSGNEDF